MKYKTELDHKSKRIPKLQPKLLAPEQHALLGLRLAHNMSHSLMPGSQKRHGRRPGVLLLLRAARLLRACCAL